ncbi:MAG: septum formation initiator family protein [Candidatus Gastranaerophilales bacterium]|nr:septum formation initiator family protein [Candidatus Gastranaerophilales bacterium]
MSVRYKNNNMHQEKKHSFNRKDVRKVYQKRIYYLFITIILVICLSQIFRGIFLNVAKYITLNKQLNKLEKLNIAAIDENNQLKEQLKNYTSLKGIEALARDNLKMVGKNEVLVVIKQ